MVHSCRWRVSLGRKIASKSGRQSPCCCLAPSVVLEIIEGGEEPSRHQMGLPLSRLVPLEYKSVEEIR
jgi:hypothetical protein